MTAPVGGVADAGPAEAAVAAPQSDPAGLYDATTGHSVGTIFADYWKAAGAGGTLGRPISELSLISAEPPRYVQYFEFARLETAVAEPVELHLLWLKASANPALWRTLSVLEGRTPFE